MSESVPKLPAEASASPGSTNRFVTAKPVHADQAGAAGPRQSGPAVVCEEPTLVGVAVPVAPPAETDASPDDLGASLGAPQPSERQAMEDAIDAPTCVTLPSDCLLNAAGREHQNYRATREYAALDPATIDPAIHHAALDAARQRAATEDFSRQAESAQDQPTRQYALPNYIVQDDYAENARSAAETMTSFDPSVVSSAPPLDLADAEQPQMEDATVVTSACALAEQLGTDANAANSHAGPSYANHAWEDEDATVITRVAPLGGWPAAEAPLAPPPTAELAPQQAAQVYAAQNYAAQAQLAQAQLGPAYAPQTVQQPAQPYVAAPVAQAPAAIAPQLQSEQTQPVAYDAAAQEANDVHALFAVPPPLEKVVANDNSWSWRGLSRKKRRRALLLAFIMMAGAWVMFLRPSATFADRPAKRGGVVGVEQVPATILSAQTPDPVAAMDAESAGTVDAASPKLDIAKAAEHLSGSRIKAALPYYQQLAAAHPERPVFAAIAQILKREVAERCRQRGEDNCQ